LSGGGRARVWMRTRDSPERLSVQPRRERGAARSRTAADGLNNAAAPQRSACHTICNSTNVPNLAANAIPNC
ncbi:MAG: hypothetical protein QF805_30730, partial [Pirellulaceae bacterium]|nr:hypothetical protein [Pirellulaceae bacterium]